MRRRIFFGVFITAFVTSGALPAQEATQTFPASGLTTLRVSQREGFTQITGINVDTIQVTTNKRKGNEKCRVELSPQVGNTFEVKLPHSILRGLSCHIDVALVIPERMAVEAKVGASTLQIGGLRGDLNLAAGTGKILGSLASSNTRIDIGTGSAELTWTEAPQSGKVEVEVTTGSAHLTFPQGTLANVAIKSGIGRVDNQLQTSADAPFAIHGSVGIGQVQLGYRAAR